MRQRIKKFKTIALLLFVSVASLMADPPDPPAGKVWILNHEMSDEFDANSPNLDKWSVFDKGNSWGRTAAFDKRIHEVVMDSATGNYYLTMNPMWYYEDERFPRTAELDYLFAGGGMVTQEMQKYGYFEVRIKPSDFPMGSGVFMNSRGTTEGSCNEKYQTELDILENMGYTGPFTGSSTGSWNNMHHINTHIKPYSDASGSCQQLAYESTNSGVQTIPLAEPLGFNTVAAWWKDDKTIDYYNNDEFYHTVTPRRDFVLPMPIIIVMETYNWGSDENNATNPKPMEWMFEDDFRTKEQRAVVYDWVRVWKLVDIDTEEFNNSVDNIKGQVDTITAYPANELSSTIIYAAQSNRELVASFYNPEGTKLVDTTYTVSTGIRTIYTKFEFGDPLSVADGYAIVYQIKDGETVLKTDTTVVNIISKPLEKKLWRDGIPTSLEPGESAYSIPVHYETDVNSTVVVEIRKPDGSWFGGGNTNVTPGNGTATVNAKPSSPLTVASNYYYKVYMYRQGMNWQDPQLVSISPTVYFNVEEPSLPSIDILTIPDEILNSTDAVDVKFKYSTDENGTLEITLINPLGKVVARELRTERIGIRTLTRTIDVDSILTSSDDYKIAINFSPENGTFEDLKDTIHNVRVTSSLVSVKNLNAKDSRIVVYPNPASGRLTIKAVDGTKLEKIEMTDLNGRLVHQTDLNKESAMKSIDVSGFAAGMYFVKLFTGDNVLTTNFIKQ